MRDPFIAVDVATDLRSHARVLRRSWEAVLGGGPATAVRPVIEASWRRTARAGIDPDVPDPRRAVAADALEDARDASGLRDCVDVLRATIGGFAQDAEHVMVVVDAHCTVLWMEGDPRVRARADRIAFEEGMDWTEESVGTNAIGTALAIDHAVQVFSAEHFSAKQHPWWCSAAPIHDPVTGDVLGVVDLSGPMHTAHPASLALVSTAARFAEERLARRHLERVLAAVPRRPAVPRTRVRLLGTTDLGLRHAEVLAILALHPEGLSAEDLTAHLYGPGGNVLSTRATVSRLRKALPGVVAGRPYRLTPGVAVDLLEVDGALRAGDVLGALRAYCGPLLPASTAPRVVRAREELEGGLRRAAVAGSRSALWAWLETRSGRDDIDALARYVRAAPAHDPRRAVAAGRLRALQRT